MCKVNINTNNDSKKTSSTNTLVNNSRAMDLFFRITEEKRERILSCAIDEFAQFGCENANVNRIAKAADISIGSLYKYFETKDDLFFYIVDIAADKMSAQIDEILNRDIRFMSKVEKLLRLAQTFSINDPSLIRLYNGLTSENDNQRALQLAAKIEELSASAYTALIKSAQQNGEIRSDIDAGILAFMLDNQLMNTQFSFACTYYRQRYALYVGEKNAADDEYVISCIMKVLKSMFAC